MDERRHPGEAGLSELKEKNRAELEAFRQSLPDVPFYYLPQEGQDRLRTYEIIERALSRAADKTDACRRLAGRARDGMDGLLALPDGVANGLRRYVAACFPAEREEAAREGSLLPEGWKWEDYGDGSGALRAPDGKTHFSYDLVTREFETDCDLSGKERIPYRYREDLPLSAFMRYAEETVEEKRKRKRLFVDMDGTLAEFLPVDTLERLYEKGYFEHLRPQEAVVEAVRGIIRECPDIEVHILSSVLADSPYALAEKNAWLDQFLPEVDRAHRLFPPCGSDKKTSVAGGVTENDFLLDDYTENLTAWDPPGRGIKLYNGINHTKGTWKKAMFFYNAAPETLAAQIAGAVRGTDVPEEALCREAGRRDPGPAAGCAGRRRQHGGR